MMLVSGLAFALLAVAVSVEVDMEAINSRFAEMQEIINEQKEMLAQHELRLAGRDFRRLHEALTYNENYTASIFGEDNATEARAYTETENFQQALDHLWLLICGALVMFMQAGFAMVESGCCRAKNVQNILLKNLTDVATGTLGWWAFGWAFAYGGPLNDDGVLENGFIGTDQFFGIGFITRRPDGQIEPSTGMLGWFFQWAFCSAASTIVSGGVAERVNFPGYVCFSFMMTAFIYPVVVAWTWGYGFLGANNYMDFAGSGIVHMSGGVGALVGAACAGARKGRWENPDSFAPHSLPLVVLGTFILWFGWYGFNCGSTLGMQDAATGMMAAFVAMNTTIAAATGGLVVFLLRFAQLRKYDIGGFCNGILAGLVSITAPCGNVECGSAFAIAIIGALVYEGSSMLLKKIGVDDPIDAFAVHGACGAWGTLATALFDMGEGFDKYHAWSGFACNLGDSGCNPDAAGGGLGVNVGGIFAIAAWVAFWSALIFAPLRFSGFLRADDDVQEDGFDARKHSPSKAYMHDNTVTEGTVVISAKVAPA